MKAKKHSDRHSLLYYRRTMSRLWKATLVLGLVLLFVWGWALLENRDFGFIDTDTLLLIAAVISLGISLFAFLTRRMAYVQPYAKHLRLITPFLRMNISYKRMRSVKPMLVQQVFPKANSNWSRRNFLEPFYGKTAVVVELSSFPMNPMLLRLFLPREMFSPNFTGFVLVVPDWMKLSTEIETFRGSLQKSQKDREAFGIRSW